MEFCISFLWLLYLGILGFKLNRILNAVFLNHYFRFCLLAEGRVNSLKETTVYLWSIINN